jgi:hypothetical protein
VGDVNINPMSREQVFDIKGYGFAVFGPEFMLEILIIRIIRIILS